jgi:two-component system sensor histidine kinase UhpB
VVAAGAWYLHRRRGTRGFWLMAVLLGAGRAWPAPSTLPRSGAGVRPLAADLARLAVPLCMVLLGLRLVQQHGRARHQAEQMKLQLEQRVREATAEIEHNFRQLAELRVEQVTERERKRIAADLHDDLGAKLLTIVHTSDSPNASARWRAKRWKKCACRCAASPASRCAWPTPGRLARRESCRAWRRPASKATGKRRRPAADAERTRLCADHAHPARSHQQHHQAQRGHTLFGQGRAGRWRLPARGAGQRRRHLRPDRRPLDRGHGLASMKNRAKALQGQCLVESGAGYGTVIRLTLPLDRAIEGS